MTIAHEDLFALAHHDGKLLREFARAKAELLRQHADVVAIEALHCYDSTEARARLEGEEEGLRKAAALLGAD